ncbi:MAG: response regulator [Alphaproteobacteria bacterium]|nr:response regulator [Alphaproteobacteria bacterium]
MTTPAHILVIDDDTRLRKLLNKYLTDNGFNVSEASNPIDAEHLLDLFIFDLIIMDIMMPQKNGLDYTKELREAKIQTPILMLTAIGDSSSRITGLENGADDYLPKPFEPRELVLRINNILRRITSLKHSDEIYFGPYQYNLTTGTLLQNNTQIALTTSEQELLKALASKAGETISREDLGTLLNTDNLRSIDVQITRLRKKLETDIKKPLCIQTVRGQGYLLALR